MCGAPYESIVKVIISLMDEAVQQGMKQNYDHHLSQNVKSLSHFLNNIQYIYLYLKETIKNMKNTPIIHYTFVYSMCKRIN